MCKFAHDLRKKVFMEHFGLEEKEAVDYFDDDVWWSMIANAEKNS